MAATNTLTPRGAWMLGLFTAATGITIIAVSILNTSARPNDPRWVGAAAGVAFVLLGVAVIKGFALDLGVVPPNDLWGALLGVLLSACLAAIAAWVAFGPGERQFRISGFPVRWVPARAGEWIGRGGFGIGAVGAGGVALGFCVRLVRRLRRRSVRDAAGPALALLLVCAGSLGVLHLTGDLRLFTPAATRALRRALAAQDLTDAQRVQLALDAKLANPAYVSWQKLPSYRQPAQAFDEEQLLKEARSRLAAGVTAPAGAEVTTIPRVTSRPPVIDGRLEPDEWNAAARLDLGHGTVLYALSDGSSLFLGCDVPSDTTADGFDQLRVYYHVGVGGVLVHERIHVNRAAKNAIDSYRLTQRPGPRGGPFSESHLYRHAEGASTMIAHRQFEARLELAETGLHVGVPFAAYVEVETDPIRDERGRFQRRVLAGSLGSQAAPVWLVIAVQ